LNAHLSQSDFSIPAAQPRPGKRHAGRIVIVDGYSTGRELVRELRGRNVECLHLQSAPEVPAEVRNCFDPSPYHRSLGYLGDAAAAAEKLAALAPDAVVAGSEWGVTFAERVAHGRGLATNRIETLLARRDKFEMVEAVRRHRLLAAEQGVVSTAEEAHRWAEAHGRWPIVAKPLASAGSDGLTICQSRADIDAAFDKVVGKDDFMGCRNDQLLMQSYLAGPQYIVNTVSWDGRHYVTDVWSQTETRSGSAIVPGGIELLDPAHPTVKALIAYTLRVLDALGIENGAAHTELKLTPQGPALIETGARLMGAAMDEHSYQAAGMQTQASVYASVLAGTDADRDALFAKRHYQPKRHMTKLLFNFQTDAVVRDTKGLDRLGRLPSFDAHYRPLAEGARVWKTADWLACGGVVYLIHDDAKQIAADIEMFRSWEKQGALYGLDPATASQVAA